MFCNRIRMFYATQTPSFVFDTFQMKRFKNKIGDFPKHKTEKLKLNHFLHHPIQSSFWSEEDIVASLPFSEGDFEAVA